METFVDRVIQDLRTAKATFPWTKVNFFSEFSGSTIPEFTLKSAVAFVNLKLGADIQVRVNSTADYNADCRSLIQDNCK